MENSKYVGFTLEQLSLWLEFLLILVADSAKKMLLGFNIPF